MSTNAGYDEAMTACDRAVGLEVGKGAIGLTPFRRLTKDPRFVNPLGILETPFPERYAEAIELLESLGRRK